MDDVVECARICKKTIGCTHFDFYLSNGDCNKKSVINIEKSDAYWKRAGVFCGVIHENNASINEFFFLL